MDDERVFSDLEAVLARPVVSASALRIHDRAAAQLARTTRSNYLADACLDSLASGHVTTMAAIELCLAGWWRRLDGGYLIIDRELSHTTGHGPGWRRASAACRRLWKVLNSESVIPL